MPSHQEHILLSYSQDQLFDLIADVKNYPHFIPWCRGAHVHRSEPNLIVALLEIGFGPFSERFTSHVDLDRPQKVLVKAVDGPLEHLRNEWSFWPVGAMTRIDFMIDFKFKSHLLDHVAEGMFHNANTRMMVAFKDRAHALYAGGSTGNPCT